MSERGRHLGYVLKRYPRISETFVAAELVELERQGEQVTVFALSRPEEPFEHAFVGQVRARVVYLPHRPLREPVRVLRALLHVWRTSPRGWLRAAGVSLAPPRLAGWRKLLQATVMRQELGRAGIDHVHAHFATSAARLANLAWRMDGPSYSVTAHAKDIYHDGVRRDHLRDKLEHATFVATVSGGSYIASSFVVVVGDLVPRSPEGDPAVEDVSIKPALTRTGARSDERAAASVSMSWTTRLISSTRPRLRR